MNKPGRLSFSTQVYIFSFLAAILVAAIYGWVNWPSLQKSGTDYYPQLALGFKSGHLYLPEQPSAALLSLSDPYNYVLRKDSNVEDFPWDISLYKEKFYIYWGPVPAVLLAALPKGLISRLGDQHLVLPFLLGLFFYSTLFTISFWLKFNHKLPAWTILPILLAIGISMPAMSMLSRPKIYEASIAASQFFYIGGCYWAFSAFSTDEQPPLWKLALAGLHWALAVGSRSIILAAIAFWGILFLVFLVQKKETIKNSIMILLALGIPLLIGAALLGWYNWARFGSITEFGVTYMLTNTDYSQFKALFSTQYLRESVLSYFLRPYQIHTEFPFIKPVENTISNDRLAGLPYTTPYLFLLFTPLLRFSSSQKESAENSNRLEKQLVIALGGASVVSLVIILAYYFTAIRFTADFMPGFLLLATIFFVQGSRQAKSPRGYIFAVMVIAGISVTASVLIAIPPSRVKEILHLVNGLGIR